MGVYLQCPSESELPAFVDAFGADVLLIQAQASHTDVRCTPVHGGCSLHIKTIYRMSGPCQKIIRKMTFMYHIKHEAPAFVAGLSSVETCGWFSRADVAGSIAPRLQTVPHIR
jgi:hypothetical protein